MKRRMTSTALMVAVLLLGVLAVPAAAQEVGDTVNGTSAEACAIAVASAYGAAGSETFDRFAPYFEDGEFDGQPTEDPEELRLLIDEVVAFLTEEGFLDEDSDFGDICGIYLEVLPEVLTFEIAGPVSFCEADIPLLELRLAGLEVDEVELFWVQVTDDVGDVDAADVYTGRDEFGDEVTGVIRQSQTVTVDPNEDGFTPVLWPGMVLNDDGDPTTWPGFAPRFENPDDVNSEVLGWDQVDDDGFADWARAQPQDRTLGVVAEFNPTTPLAYTGYPPATAECAGPPEIEVLEEVLQRPTHVPTQVLGTSSALPRTGVDAVTLSLFGLLLLGLGVVALRRTRSEADAG